MYTYPVASLISLRVFAMLPTNLEISWPYEGNQTSPHRGQKPQDNVGADARGGAVNLRLLQSIKQHGEGTKLVEGQHVVWVLFPSHALREVSSDNHE